MFLFMSTGPMVTRHYTAWWVVVSLINSLSVFIKAALTQRRPKPFSQQGHHIAFVIKEALSRGVTALEPSQQAQDNWVKHVRETAIDVSQLQRECTPSYFNNEGEAQTDSKGDEKYRWYLGEAYGPGWDAFQDLMQAWRASGDLEGLVLEDD